MNFTTSLIKIGDFWMRKLDKIFNTKKVFKLEKYLRKKNCSKYALILLSI